MKVLHYQATNEPSKQPSNGNEYLSNWINYCFSKLILYISGVSRFFTGVIACDI